MCDLGGCVFFSCCLRHCKLVAEEEVVLHLRLTTQLQSLLLLETSSTPVRSRSSSSRQLQECGWRTCSKTEASSCGTRGSAKWILHSGRPVRILASGVGLCLWDTRLYARISCSLVALCSRSLLLEAEDSINEDIASEHANSCPGISRCGHRMRRWPLGAFSSISSTSYVSTAAPKRDYRDDLASGRSSWLRILADNPGARWDGTLHVVGQCGELAQRNDAGEWFGYVHGD
jgi:hypothetical protein